MSIDPVEILIYSAMISALYALVAIGFTMIFGVARVLNLAHGAFIMLSAYITHLAHSTGLNLYLSLALAIVGCVLFALLTCHGIISPIQGSLGAPITIMIATLALALLLQQGFTIAFGPTPRSLPPLVEGSSLILGTRVINNRIVAFGVSWGLIGVLWVFMSRTRRGKAILATAMDARGAALVGIDPKRIQQLTWAISGALAAIAGFFLASFLTLTPQMWIDPLIIAFSIVILGGLGSIGGSVAAAYFIGTIETFTAFTVSGTYAGLPSLLILVLVLALRPQGFFGRIEES
ncbi:MAG: branched-chain amino acid ABC transporter permease [Candidatus Bipolaricaulia bacterium]